MVIGVGPIGRQVASRLEVMGVDVYLLDLSPINLHAFAQQGFHTVAGDARDPQVLQRADAVHCGLAVVSVLDHEVANQVVRTLVADEIERQPFWSGVGIKPTSTVRRRPERTWSSAKRRKLLVPYCGGVNGL